MQKKIYKQIIIACSVLIGINVISSMYYARFDLTEDSRYTLSATTQEYVKDLQDTIRFSVYLHGDLPVSFVKMERELTDFLKELKRIGKEHIQIKFFDPRNLGSNAKENREAFARLTQYGLKPYTIQEQDESGTYVQRHIIPGMIMSTSERYVPVNLFADGVASGAEELIFEALGRLEYMCVKGIMQLTTEHKKNIAFLTDHGELPFLYVKDATLSLMELYNIDRITTPELLDSINKYDLVIVAKPQKPFSDEHKFIIDQYLMRNGAFLGFIDAVDVNADTLQYVSNVTAVPFDLHISDLLFHLGVRINPTILLDNQCAKIPLNLAPVGMPPNYQPVSWYYFPIVSGTQSHLISQHLSPVKTEFVSSLDTLEGGGKLQKTILLRSSAYARILQTPVQVGFSVLERIRGDYFTSYYVPVAALVEGELESFYQYRATPLPAEQLPENFTTISKTDSVKMIFVADGDVIKNDVSVRGRDTIAQPLHYYKYFAVDKNIYSGNKEFLLNAVNYLCGDTELIPLRSREVTVRMLNRARVLHEKSKWQMFTVLLPIILLSFVGGGVVLIRKNKYKKYGS